MSQTWFNWEPKTDRLNKSNWEIGEMRASNISRDKGLFSDISEWNNDYSDTLDLRMGWVGEVGMVTFFVLEVPD